MPFVALYAECHTCGRPFTCNPHLVPSHRTTSGQVVFCRICVEGANPLRVEKGLAPIPILPGAYEPADENSRDF